METTTKNTAPTALSLETLRRTVPSIFSKGAAPKMSDRYAFISTAELISPLLKTYDITQASQRSTRKNGRDPSFTRHIVRLRPKGAKAIVGGTFPEVLVTNSHDGQSKFSIFAGLFRLVCSNGLVISWGPNAGGAFVHVGDRDRILDQAAAAVKLATSVEPVVTAMTKKVLTEKQMNAFARAAAILAYGEDFDRFDPALLLAAKRDEDKEPTVWNVYNRLQENVTRGGVSFVSAASQRTFATRGITHIGRTIDFNTGLWDLAAKHIKKAA